MSTAKNGPPITNRLGIPTRVIVLGNYDGPTEGVVQFGGDGPVYHFEMPDEEAQLASNTSPRTYHLHPLPAGTIDRIASALEPLGSPTWPVWAPLWQFPTQDVEKSVSAMIEKLLRDAGAAEWEVRSSSPASFDDLQAVPIGSSL